MSAQRIFDFMVTIDRERLTRLLQQITHQPFMAPQIKFEKENPRDNEKKRNWVGRYVQRIKSIAISTYDWTRNEITIFPERYFQRDTENAHVFQQRIVRSLAHELSIMLLYQQAITGIRAKICSAIFSFFEDMDTKKVSRYVYYGSLCLSFFLVLVATVPFFVMSHAKEGIVIIIMTVVILWACYFIELILLFFLLAICLILLSVVFSDSISRTFYRRYHQELEILVTVEDIPLSE